MLDCPPDDDVETSLVVTMLARPLGFDSKLVSRCSISATFTARNRRRKKIGANCKTSPRLLAPARPDISYRWLRSSGFEIVDRDREASVVICRRRDRSPAAGPAPSGALSMSADRDGAKAAQVGSPRLLGPGSTGRQLQVDSIHGQDYEIWRISCACARPSMY